MGCEWGEGMQRMTRKTNVNGLNSQPRARLAASFCAEARASTKLSLCKACSLSLASKLFLVVSGGGLGSLEEGWLATTGVAVRLGCIAGS